MVKVRMNTADVAAEVKCLRRLIGMRCSNIYDLTPKTYVFKLMNSSGETESGESEKVLLLMESGARLHTTVYMRDKSNTPSGFTLKLRKHIRTRRLEDVRQLGYDRIIVFQFGLGVNAHYVILELYAQGNILLTDSDFTVLTLLRSHRDDDKGFAIMSQHRYPVEVCRTFERTTTDKLHTTLISYLHPDKDLCSETNDVDGNSSGAHQENQEKQKDIKPVDTNKNTKDGPRAKQLTLKTVLGEVLGYGPALSEHMIIDAGLIPNTKVGKDFILDDDTLTGLSEAVTRFENWLEEIISGVKIPEGYILLQKSSGRKDTENLETGIHEKIYDEYCPLLLNQFKSRDSMKFETFDAALDEFYSKIESQRVEQQQKSKESTAVQKLNKIRADQENRVHILRREVEHCVKMAELIEYNLDDVDAAILAVRVALANGMSWVDLARMVKEEKKSGNPVAGLIDKLNLEKNCITLLLSNNLDEMDDDEKTLPADKVEVDLALSAHANARRWYGMKKKQESKQEKTVTAHEKAFKAAEKKTRLQLSQEKVVAAISHMRKVHWFEKFNWFISSENYLVISGHDAQQNEMIVKRYMSKGDLYVHAELHGASSTIIKNHKPDSQVPPLTLTQAGCFTVCHSQAWDSKIVTSAWWVYPHQVSKTAPTGEYLTVGSFMIRGKKNFLPPHPLVMGFGLLFRLDESSLGAHLNERRVRGEEETEITEDKEQYEEHNEVPDSESEEEVSEERDGAESQSIQDLAPKMSGPEQFSSELEPRNDLNNIDNSTSLSGTVETTTHPNGSNENDASSKTDNTSLTPQLEDLLDKALELGSAPVSAKRFGLQSSQVSLEHDDGAKKATQRDKPYVSKAERRKLKKGQKDSAEDAADADVEQRNKDYAESRDSESKSEKMTHELKLQGGKPSRGQKGKLKKIKEKYADQDEEERSIRMALLAPAGKPQKTEKVSDKKPIDVAIEKPSAVPEDAIKICYKCKKVGHLSRDCQEHLNEKMTTNFTSDVMDKVEMEEEGIYEIGEEEKEKLQEVDYLTGIPLPTDILMYAVPVCGPYNALQSYKYRVKLVPGTLKKGKAAKMSMNLFSHMPDATIREKELMKACTDPELVSVMVGNSKVTAAGLSQLKQKQKRSKKSTRGQK